MNPAFTTREKDVCARLADGFPRKIISAELRISLHTLDIHLANIRKKIPADTTFQAGLWLQRHPKSFRAA